MNPGKYSQKRGGAASFLCTPEMDQKLYPPTINILKLQIPDNFTSGTIKIRKFAIRKIRFRKIKIRKIRSRKFRVRYGRLCRRHNGHPCNLACTFTVGSAVGTMATYHTSNGWRPCSCIPNFHTERWGLPTRGSPSGHHLDALARAANSEYIQI